MTTLSNRAFDAIKERLLSGRFEAGQLLSERRLAAELGMSKTPVRSALARLATEGFVEASPQRGVVVRGVGVREVADCFELRMVLEPYVMRQLAGRLTADQARELARHVDRLRAAAERGDSARSAELDLQLHLSFATMLGNAEIARVVESLGDKIRVSIGAVHRNDPRRLVSGHEEHERMVRALARGDGERAASLMLAHLERGKRALFPRNV